MTLTFDLTHDLDLGCFKVHISGMVGPIDVKRKEVHWLDTGYNM